MVETRQADEVKEIVVGKQKSRVRDRIFNTACELFYQHGIRAVGVDTIACQAGTNKMSFYRSFPSKDELVVAYLEDQVRQAWELWDETIAPYPGDPRAQIEALFELHVKETSKLDSRGCALANATVELPADHPAHAVIKNKKHEARRRFRKLARELGAAQPDALGDALMLLWEGTYQARLSFGVRHGPASNAAKAVKAMIDAYVG